MAVRSRLRHGLLVLRSPPRIRSNGSSSLDKSRILGLFHKEQASRNYYRSLTSVLGIEREGYWQWHRRFRHSPSVRALNPHCPATPLPCLPEESPHETLPCTWRRQLMLVQGRTCWALASRGPRRSCGQSQRKGSGVRCWRARRPCATSSTVPPAERCGA